MSLYDNREKGTAQAKRRGGARGRDSDGYTYEF
jgi:hypothetical protein